MATRDDARRGLERVFDGIRDGWNAAARRRLTVRDREGQRRASIPLTIVVIAVLIALLRPPFLLLLAGLLVFPLLLGYELRIERTEPTAEPTDTPD